MPKKKSRRKKKQSILPKIWNGVVVVSKGIWAALVFLGKGARWFWVKFQTTTKHVKKKTQQKKIEKKRQQIGVATNFEPFRILEIAEGMYESFEKKLLEGKSTIGIILGARGTGKSAIGMRMLENIQQQAKRPCYAMGFSEDKLPSWIKTATTLEEIAPGSIVLIDEGGILFSSRKSMSEANTFLSEALLVARHNDLSIVFISQNSANLEVNALRQADYLLMKPSSLLQKDFERKKIRDIYDDIEQGFSRYEGDPGLAYIYSSEFRGFVSNSLPSFWNTELSKSFRKEK